MSSLTLDEIGLRHGCDKASSHHGYLRHYAVHLASLRSEAVKVLEIGYQFGLGMKVWLDYFENPHASFAAVDCVDNHIACEDSRFVFSEGDQGKREFWDGFNPFLAPFDIIIDDASHRAVDQQESFTALWPRLASGGYYCIEDTQTWADSHFDSCVSGLRWMGVLIGCLNRNGKEYHGKPYPLPVVILDQMETSIAAMHFYNGLVIIKKK